MNNALDVHVMNEIGIDGFDGVPMQRVTDEGAESSRIMLGLLDAVAQERVQSQRHLAVELGIALGLVNAYLKRCVKKGLVKVRQAPARRYAYYLTPDGFTEKSRLTVEYLSYSFGFFRQAKSDCTALFRDAKVRGTTSVLLVGKSDLAEIAALCALEQNIKIVGLVQKDANQSQFIGVPVFEDFDAVSCPFDAVFIADLINTREVCSDAVSRFGVQCVLVPEMLRMRIGRGELA